MLRTGIAGLVAGVAEEPLLDEDGAPVALSVLVDVDADPIADVDAVVAAAQRSARLLVGVGDGRAVPTAVLAALDLTLTSADDVRREAVQVDDPLAVAEEIGARIARSPRAALVLAGLLRWSVDLPVPGALEAESAAYSTLLAGPEFRCWLDARGPRPLPPVAVDPVLLTRTGATLTITLNRPERRNAFGRQVRDGLVDALSTAALDPGIGRVVLTGAGPCFCSGGDLDEFGSAPDLVTAHLVRTYGGAALPLHRIAERVEVRVHGRCVGAGVELPAFAGRVVAAPGTTFRLPELEMGLLPGAGGTVGVPRRIGRWRTMFLALSGAELDLDRAMRWGLVDERLTPDERSP